MQKRLWNCVISLVLVTCATLSAEGKALIELDSNQEAQCLSIVRHALASDEFWPSMHAAEALTLAGYGEEVRRVVEPMLATVTDSQHRCGLARELVRAGDLSKARILLDLLASSDTNGHVHAAESSYKVWQIGDGEIMRAAFADRDNPNKARMAAAALARCGNPEALTYLRNELQSEDADTARIAAWVLGRVGDASDVPALRTCIKRFKEPLATGFFVHALAALGDSDGIRQLEQHLASDDATVRTMAATFAGEIGLHYLKDKLLAMLEDEHTDARIRSAQSLLRMARVTAPKLKGIVVSDVYPATEANPRYSEGEIGRASCRERV